MRVKRQKRFRRAVRFYKASFGFREPFKVLCDGNFQHTVRRRGLRDLDKLLSQALGGPAKAFTTRCMNAELKKLGENFVETLNAARKLHLAKCDHEPAKGGRECLESLVENFNPEHFFVATQDRDLREKLRVMPGCAVIYSKKTTLSVEPPSDFQQQFAKKEEDKREGLREEEHQVLHLSEESEKPQKLTKEQRLMVRDRPTFKKKRAKGPNPLSCKKKKQVPAPSTNGEKSSRKRSRLKSRKKIDEAKDTHEQA